MSIVLLVSSVLGAPATVRAAEAEEPELLIKQGNDLRRRGDNLRAHGYFKRAYELSKTARTAAQLGLVDVAIDEFVDAEPLLSEALDSDDPWVRANKKGIETGRAIAREHLGKVTVAGAPPDTTVVVDGKRKIKLRENGELWLSPGDATLRFEAPGYEPVSPTIAVAIGKSAELKIAPRAKATAVATTTPEPRSDAANRGPTTTAATVTAEPARDSGGGTSRTARIAGLAVAGAGVALGVTGALLWRSAGSKVSAIESAAASSGTYDAADGNWQTYDRAGIALMAVGTAAVATGVVLYVLNREHGGAGGGDARVALGWVPGAGGGGALQIGGRF